MQISNPEAVQFCTIKQAVGIFNGISESYLRQLNKRGILPGPMSGNRKLINVRKFTEMLDSGVLDNAEEVEDDA